MVLSQDNEAYRATLRGEIREWLETISRRRDNEWLIVHVTTGSTLASSKFYQRKGSVVDKIRADFNTGKRDRSVASPLRSRSRSPALSPPSWPCDARAHSLTASHWCRCVQVAQNRSDDPTAWAEFSSKVKEGIITTFDANVALYEEDVRKADSQRQLEGWQYLTFFLQKVSKIITPAGPYRFDAVFGCVAPWRANKVADPRLASLVYGGVRRRVLRTASRR